MTLIEGNRGGREKSRRELEIGDWSPAPVREERSGAGLGWKTERERPSIRKRRERETKDQKREGEQKPKAKKASFLQTWERGRKERKKKVKSSMCADERTRGKKKDLMK